jgi:hypothetical protein
MQRRPGPLDVRALHIEGNVISVEVTEHDYKGWMEAIRRCVFESNAEEAKYEAAQERDRRLLEAKNQELRARIDRMNKELRDL